MVLVAITTKSAPLVVVCAALLGLVAVIDRRVRAGVGAQRVTVALVAVAGFFLATSIAPEDPSVRDRITGLWCSLTLSMVLPTIARGVFAKPEAGARLTLALGVLAFAFAGQLKVTPWYPPLAWSFAGASIFAMRVDDHGRPRMRALPRRSWAIGALILGSAVGGVALASRALPPLHARAVERVMRALRGAGSTGFDEHFALGSLESMLVSDEVVARVYGPSPEFLRGIAYNRYAHGHWTTRSGAARPQRTRVGALRGDDVTHVEALTAQAPVYFVPLRHRGLSTVDGVAGVDPLGAIWRVRGDRATSVWYRDGVRSLGRPAPPSADDTALPRNLRKWVTPTARAWTEGAPDDEARVERIVRRLRAEYRYRVATRRSPHVDPVLDFLFTRREGNCEYFASAAAVLARAVGVPTRVVGGYRVGERNPIGGFHVVRERNAHAWIEVWSPRGEWITVDPTPPRATPANLAHRTPWHRALYDAFAAWLSQLRRALTELTATQLLVAAGALLVLWQLWRRWRARFGPRDDTRRFLGADLPLPCLPRLEAQLRRRGLERRPGETIEGQARRIARSDALAPALRDEVRDALLGYAAARYGHADPDDAARRVETAAEKLNSQLH